MIKVDETIAVDIMVVVVGREIFFKEFLFDTFNALIILIFNIFFIFFKKSVVSSP